MVDGEAPAMFRCRLCEGTGFLWAGRMVDSCPLCVDESMEGAQHVVPRLYDVADNAGWRAALERDGYVVLEKFLAPGRREELLVSWWNELQTKYPNIVRERQHTWGRIKNNDEYFRPQSNFMWDLRTEPRVAEVFSKVHQVPMDKLCVSLDQYSFVLRGKSKGLKLHVDQTARRDERSDMCCVQGAYNFFDVGKKELGFVVVPKSHLRWGGDGGIGIDKFGVQGHFAMMDPRDSDWVWAHRHKSKLIIPENCFVLWDSKTVHGTCPGDDRSSVKNRPGMVPIPNRLTVFVCMMPRAARAQGVLQQKIELYKRGGFTSHWANFGGNNEEWGEARPGRLTEEGEIPPERLALL